MKIQIEIEHRKNFFMFEDILVLRRRSLKRKNSVCSFFFKTECHVNV